jgi:SOS-response transcriptional repressor LexA
MIDDTQDQQISDNLIAVHNGFPNPAMEQDAGLALNLNHLLIKRPRSTYLFRIAGHQWVDQGIYDGDIVVVDRAGQAGPNTHTVCWQNDSFIIRHGRQLAAPELAWGVISAVIHLYPS